MFDQEPLPPEHPLLRLDNVVLTPHVGYVTRETYAIFFGEAVEDILAFLGGSPVRVLELVISSPSEPLAARAADRPILLARIGRDRWEPHHD